MTAIARIAPGQSLAHAVDDLLDATAEFRRSESLLAEVLPLADATVGRTGGSRPANTARLLDTAHRWRVGAQTFTAMVRELHAAILDAPVRRSSWRTGPSEVRRRDTGELVHRGVAPARIAHEIDEIERMRAGTTDAVAAAFECYAELQRIHPFDDGNGRVGRAALHLDLSRSLGIDLPPIGLLLAAQGASHAEALTAHHRGDADAWRTHVEDCLHRAAISARR